MIICSVVLMFSRGTLVRGTFISHVSALPLVHIIYNIIFKYVTKLVSGNGINFALIYLLISTKILRTTACL